MEAAAPLDLVLLGWIGIGAWRGMRAGAMMQLVGTIGVLAAYAAGAALMEPVGRAVVFSLDVSPRIGPLAGFLVVFAAVLTGAYLAGRFAAAVLSALRMGLLERIGGALLGAVKAAFLLSITLMVLAPALRLAGALTEEQTASSALYDPVRAFAPEAWALWQRVVPGLADPIAERLQAWADPALQDPAARLPTPDLRRSDPPAR